MRNGMELFFSRIGLAVKGFASSHAGEPAAYVPTNCVPRVRMSDWASGQRSKQESKQNLKNEFPKSRRPMEESSVVLDVTTMNPSARELRRLDKIRQFLREQEMVDPSASLETAVYYPDVDSSLARVAGRFGGVLHAGNGSLHRIEFSVDLEQARRGVRAVLRGALGEEASTRKLAADYHLRYVAGHGGQFGATLLQIADNAFLQMYYVKNLDLWVANYYSASHSDTYKLVGQARFMRHAEEEDEVTFASTSVPAQ